MRNLWVLVLLGWSCGATAILIISRYMFAGIFEQVEQELDCASSDFEFSEEMSLWTEFLQRMEIIKPLSPLSPRKKHSRFTVLATFPNSGTGMIQDFVAELTHTCRLTVYGSECKNPKLSNPLDACVRIDANQASWALRSCLKARKIRHVPVGLTKSHLNLQNSCQGISYKHDADYFNTTIHWRTKKFGQILHLIRNPWDNVMSRVNLSSSRLCQDTLACEGFLEDVRENKSIGTKQLVFVSESVEISVLRLIAMNDFIGWLAFHHQLAHRIRQSRYQHLTVLYENVVSNPLNLTLKIARFMGHKEGDLHIGLWDEWWRETGKMKLKNKGKVCKDGRVVPVKLQQIPKPIRLEINSRFRAYLDDDPSWMEPVRSTRALHDEVKFTEEFKRAFHYCFES